MPVASAITNLTFRCRFSRSRNGVAIFPSDRIPVEHWYSKGWNRWCSARSSSVTSSGARRSARAANRPAKPPPMITTRRRLSWSFMARPALLLGPYLRWVSPAGSARGVVPLVSFGEQSVGLLGPPGALGVGVHRHHVTEHRVDDLPGVLDGVLAGEQPALVVECGADQPVIRALVGPGLLRERQILGLRLPPRPRLLAPH